MAFPFRLLAGEKDPVLTPTTVRRAGELPNARVEVVTDAPHSMYRERPDPFDDAIRRLLKEVAAS
jgi:pimeloyl-ACP methyl ester carboxylesterase